MPNRTMRIMPISFTPGSQAEEREGLLGFVQVVLGDLIQLDGIAVRRTRDGRHILAFPERTARDGKRYPLVRPLDADARRRIEAAVIGALKSQLERER